MENPREWEHCGAGLRTIETGQGEGHRPSGIIKDDDEEAPDVSITFEKTTIQDDYISESPDHDTVLGVGHLFATPVFS